MAGKASIIGAGPNGLAAAIFLAQAGLELEVFEAEPIPGGAARTLELTLPGFLHDFGSAVHPMAISSPFFSSLPLQDYGLEWIHSPSPLAHPLEDGSAVVMERDLATAESWLGADGKSWRNLMRPFAERWREFVPEVLRPLPTFPRHPFLMARFGLNALLSARKLAFGFFREERARALFAGFAAHSFLSLDAPISAAFGLLMAIPAHAVGWPIARGGSQSITNALCAHLEKLGGNVHCSARIDEISSLPPSDAMLCDLTPRQLLQVASTRLSPAYKKRLQNFRYGPGVFKVDYALSNPIPWKASECARAATVHLGGTFEEIAASEAAVSKGLPAEQPFVLLAQPTLFDPSRAPAGKHIAWAYCHVPNGSTFDMLPRLEAQIERFAPGFCDCILARRVFTPSDLEKMDANLIGGDVGGGALDLRQFLFRPTWQHYATSVPNLYICSASTPPGGSVHGMCGYHAARMALSRMKRS
ncbi:MAG: NAD(P)/FAD-dependent oxidoreductase [Acidobacteriaceae bacterium]|nr:NAD(P)/FAD-dependent oxidoreductase [Acidobacteriaceae bacterium]